MFFPRLLPISCLWALGVYAQSDSGSVSQTILTGTPSETVPTGSYLSYSSTITLPSPTSSAISTETLLSTITSDRTTRTTTLGTTTIFGINEATIASNTTGTRSSTTASQYLLTGAGHSTTMTATASAINGTSNSTATSTSSSVEPTNTTPCNNYVEFCGRSYDNITEVAAHNSPFVRSGNAAANQALPVTTQLNDGIRLLQGQMHFNGSVPHFCHTSCDILDAGPITEYLDTVYSWVSTHPFDVVTIILENGDYRPVTDYVSFIESTGLVQYAYEPPKIPMALGDWPTLASMILTGKRVVFFMDYDANQTAVPWILDEFSQVWETPFDPTDRSFPCDTQRPPNLSSEDAKTRMYLTNHNLNYDVSILGNSLLVPNIPLLNVTNNVTGSGSLGEGAQVCYNDWNFPPKFLNVDYYNVGNGSVFQVAAKWNNVTYNRQCCGLVASVGDRSFQTMKLAAVLVAGFVMVVNLI